MKIGFHTYEPAISQGNDNTSAGGGTWLRALMAYLSEKADVYWVHGEDDASAVPEHARMSLETAAEELDVLFMPWRWAMPAYPERHQKWMDQTWLIGNMKGHIVIHDEDHKLNEADEITLKSMDNVTLTTPEMNPRSGYRSLLFPMPFHPPSSEFYSIKYDQLFGNEDGERATHLIYIGNNYERYEQTKKYLSLFEGMSPFMNIQVYGNWMEPGPGRQPPAVVAGDFPNVDFLGRLPQEQVLAVMSGAASTLMLHKPSYGPQGFMTIRWAEAVAAGCIAFIPKEFWLPKEMKALFDADHLVVHSAKDLLEKFDYVTARKARYMGVLLRQQQLIKGKMSLLSWWNLAKEVYND